MSSHWHPNLLLLQNLPVIAILDDPWCAFLAKIMGCDAFILQSWGSVREDEVSECEVVDKPNVYCQ